MESIGKNLTASTILSRNLPASQSEPKNAESTIQDPQDTLTQGDPAQNADFKKKTALLPLSLRGKQSITLGAIAGGLVGGVGGGVYANSLAVRKEITSAELNEVELTWKEPVMQADTLGSVPRNFHTIAFTDKDALATCDSRPDNIVIVDNPVMDENGTVKMREVSAKWANFGKPRVTINPEKIEHKRFTGFKEEIKPVTVKTTQASGSAAVNSSPEVKGGATYEEKLVGYNHDHVPLFNKTTLGYYDKPMVDFDKGVNVIGYTVIGGLVGVAVGVTVGVLAGAMVEKVRLVSEANAHANK